MLQAALAELVASGYEGATTAAIARRAGASKQTLYRWFGDRNGIFAELIERNSAAVASSLDLDRTEPVAATLRRLARRLLALLLGPESLALNRAAIASPALARVLRASGRNRVAPVVTAWLAEQDASGTMTVPDASEAFETFVGLVVGERQVRALLGAPTPSKAERDRWADRAVEHFLVLHRP